MQATIPPDVRQLLWDVDPSNLDVAKSKALILERVMTRGSLAAMRWLLTAFDHGTLRGFVQGPCGRALPPRELAFWSTLLGLELSSTGRHTGGGRPGWAD